MEKIRINELIVVEGKYDAIKLNSIVDALIITTDGFSIFKSKEIKDLIINLGAKRGVIVLTDSDVAGFQIRNYINNFACSLTVKHAYIPAIKGKEKRKTVGGKEGLLGVEGVDAQQIRNALLQVCKPLQQEKAGQNITYYQLYELGISGTNNSAENRKNLLKTIGLPLHLSKKALLEVLNSLYTFEELQNLCCDK